jgi:hypothetical protein
MRDIKRKELDESINTLDGNLKEGIKRRRDKIHKLETEQLELEGRIEQVFHLLNVEDTKELVEKGIMGMLSSSKFVLLCVNSHSQCPHPLSFVIPRGGF